MDLVVAVIAFAVGLAVGGLAIWLSLRGRTRAAFDQGKAASEAERSAATARLEERDRQLRDLQSTLRDRESSASSLREQLSEVKSTEAGLRAQLVEERKSAIEKLALLDQARQQLSDAFKALSADALKHNSSSFLELARTSLEKFQSGARDDLEKRQQSIVGLVNPIRESLDKVDGKLRELELIRANAYATLTEQVRNLHETQSLLRSETANLVKALRAPTVRGRWGEIQLRRVVELAGMVEHCDFCEQQSVTTEEGRLRPDLVVKLPGGKNVVVDAKVPLAAYLEAVEAVDDDARRAKLQEHAQQVRVHVTALSRKAYWEQFDPAPEFVVLFLPGEMFFSAALEQDPALIECGVEQKVIIATPTTLIGLLKAVAYGWRQERLAENAKAISSLGRELYKRLSDLGSHMSKLGKSLGTAVDAYNRSVGSLESRVLVSARRFKELAAADDELVELGTVDQVPRALQAPEHCQERPDQSPSPEVESLLTLAPRGCASTD